MDEEHKFDVITLSKNAIRDICYTDTAAAAKNQEFYVQVIDVKVFTPEENKKNIK
jgi:hypothetical protein